TTTSPQRAADGAGTSAATALLLPRLLATAGNVGTGLLRAGSLTTASHVGDNCLVHQILVKLFAKGGIGNSESSGLAFWACNIQFHRLIPLRLLSGTNDHITTGGARHGTLDQQQIARGIDPHHLKILDSNLFGTHMAGHLLALEDSSRGLVLTD